MIQGACKITEARQPIRIQRSRKKGWRMPPGAVYVGRPTLFGNPFTAEAARAAGYGDGHLTAVWAFRTWLEGAGKRGEFAGHERARRQAIEQHLADLRGKDLVCWCPLDRPCHADVLLELANA